MQEHGQTLNIKLEALFKKTPRGSSFCNVLKISCMGNLTCLKCIPLQFFTYNNGVCETRQQTI
jgi:hypothetical protein